jgi:23S rRNA maturation mini-RNase III
MSHRPIISAMDRALLDTQDDESEEEETGLDSEANSGQERVSSSSDVNRRVRVEGCWNKCRLCSSRMGSRECTQELVCVACCTDQGCEYHIKKRAATLFRNQVLSGTTDIHVLAEQLRSKRLPNKRFREPGLKYQGDTVVIWCLRQFMSNPKWREDVMRKRRKSFSRTNARAKVTSETMNNETDNSRRFSRNTKQARIFRSFIEDQYQKHSISGPVQEKS